MQTGVSSSKVLILVGAGLTSSIILKSGRLSDVISQLQELIKGVDEAESYPGKIDAAVLAAQIRQLAQEIRELSLSNPITVFSGCPSSSRPYSSYLVPAAAIGAMGYYYMRWKGWSFSDVMFVTKQNMSNAVASVSKQLENVSESLLTTRQHLMKKLDILDWKVDEQKDMTKLIADDVNDVRSNLSQIGGDIELIHLMVNAMEGKLELLECKQDMTNSGLSYLCQIAGGLKDGLNGRMFQDVGSKSSDQPKISHDENALKGLKLIADSKESASLDKLKISTDDLGKISTKNGSTARPRIHRSYPVGLSLAGAIMGAD